MINKIKTVLLITISIAFMVILLLYSSNRNQLKEKCKLLTQAELNIKALQQSNANLLKYTSEKETELKKVKEDYKNALHVKPKDDCGDSKPSKELLDFFKGNIQ